jgi:hypothetical protein
LPEVALPRGKGFVAHGSQFAVLNGLELVSVLLYELGFHFLLLKLLQ